MTTSTDNACRGAYLHWIEVNKTSDNEAFWALFQAGYQAAHDARVGDIWQYGFPQEGGAYLVELSDGEMVVTHWNDGTGKNTDSWGEKRRTGWSCLTDSRSTVKRWIKCSILRTAPASRVNEWQPIESAPKKHGQLILLMEGDKWGGIYAGDWMPEYQGWRVFCGQPVIHTPEPTHWMPLPEPPQARAAIKAASLNEER